MAYPTLETERLVLRPLVRSDLGELSALHAQESFWHHPFRRGWTDEETKVFLDRTIEAYEGVGFAVSGVVLRGRADLMGWAGLAIPSFLPEVLPAVEVGWRLGEQFRGRGYATEAGSAWVDHGFERRRLAEILSICEPANTASAAVMRRLGFGLGHETVHPRLGVDLHVMKLTRAAWSGR